mgnify:FL=1
MKKILLGTTALVAATAVSAGAAKADMSVSGWSTFGLGFGAVEAGGTGVDAGAGNLDVYENGEIYFNGSTELDNGMTVSWDVQLETENGNGNFIDENYFTIGGDFGTVIIGQENLPNYKMHYTGGMWVGNSGLSSNGYTQFSGSPGGISYFHSGFMNDTAPVGNDADMVSYYTPRMSGFQLGVGWMPDSDQNDAGHTSAGDLSDTFEDTLSIGANYTTDMDGTSIAVSAGYTSSDVQNAGNASSSVEVETHQVGVQVGMGGFTFGASYMEQIDDTNARTGGDTENILLGVTYATGPHTIGLSGIWSEAEETTAIAADTEGQAIMIAHDYSLGGGVSLSSSVTFIDIDDEVAGAANDSDGLVGMVMLNAGF